MHSAPLLFSFASICNLVVLFCCPMSFTRTLVIVRSLWFLAVNFLDINAPFHFSREYFLLISPGKIKCVSSALSFVDLPHWQLIIFLIEDQTFRNDILQKDDLHAFILNVFACTIVPDGRAAHKKVPELGLNSDKFMTHWIINWFR